MQPNKSSPLERVRAHSKWPRITKPSGTTNKLWHVQNAIATSHCHSRQTKTKKLEHRTRGASRILSRLDPRTSSETNHTNTQRTSRKERTKRFENRSSNCTMSMR